MEQHTRVFFIVENKDGKRPYQPFGVNPSVEGHEQRTKEYALQWAAECDKDIPNSAPHRVIRRESVTTTTETEVTQ